MRFDIRLDACGFAIIADIEKGRKTRVNDNLLQYLSSLIFRFSSDVVLRSTQC